VTCDGVAVGNWRAIGGNISASGWKETDFLLPASVTAGKSSITIRLTKTAASEPLSQFRLSAYTILTGPGAALPPAPGATVNLPNADFESGDLTGWTTTGNAFTDAQVVTQTVQDGVSFNQHGSNHYWGYGGGARDTATGTMRTANFLLGGDGRIEFLMGGGNDIANLNLALVRASDDAVLLSATGTNTERYQTRIMDAAEWVGTTVYLKATDTATGGWGHINIDYLRVPVSAFTNNLTGSWSAIGGTWQDTPAGLQGSAPGDAFMMNSQVGSNFVIESDLTLTAHGAATLIFRAADDASSFYAANIASAAQTILFWGPGSFPDHQAPANIELNTTYHLKVVADGPHIQVYWSGHADGAEPLLDFTEDALMSGHFGVNVWAGTAVFQNLVVSALPEPGWDVSTSAADPNLYWSPNNWWTGPEGQFKQTSATGAYLKMAFTGTGLGLGVDRAGAPADLRVTAYVDGSNEPTGQATMADAETTGQSVLRLASDLSEGTHTATIFLNWNPEDSDRWNGQPPNALRVTGLTFGPGGEALPLEGTAAEPKAGHVLFFGDSITQWGGEGRWTGLVAEALGFEYGNIGYSGQGWSQVAPGGAGVPYFYPDGGQDTAGAATWRWHSEGKSRLDESGGFQDGSPAAVFVNMGTNDALQDTGLEGIKDKATYWLADVRAAAPGATIYLITPFCAGTTTSVTRCDQVRDELIAAQAGLVASDPEARIYLLDLGQDGYDWTHGQYGDGIHPNDQGNALIAERLVEMLTAPPEPEPIDVSVEVSGRCMAGRIYVAVAVTNPNDQAVVINASTPFGSKAFGSVVPNKTVSMSVTSRTTSIPGDQVLVEAIGADGRSVQKEVQFGPYSCS
jgi:lysophospholipase L1-like esterase